MHFQKRNLKSKKQPCFTVKTNETLEMWANAQRDGRPA